MTASVAGSALLSALVAVAATAAASPRTPASSAPVSAAPAPATDAPAGDSPTVSFQGRLSPDALGASTTVTIAFNVEPSVQTSPPPPLSSFSVRLPTGMGFATTTLGLSTCSPQALASRGATACPHESLMGFGSALVQAPFGQQEVSETAAATIFMSRPVDGHTTLLFFFDGTSPVIEALVLQSQVLTPEGTSSSVLDTPIPQIPTAPGAAAVSVLGLRANIGPRGIVYHKRVGGHRVAYRPKGLSVPESCPHGGFVFVGEFGFADGSRVVASSVVPCPGRKRHTRRRVASHGGRR